MKCAVASIAPGSSTNARQVLKSPIASASSSTRVGERCNQRLPVWHLLQQIRHVDAGQPHRAEIDLDQTIRLRDIHAKHAMRGEAAASGDQHAGALWRRQQFATWRYPANANAARSRSAESPPRYSDRISTSASWRANAATMPASREPPPCRMFQASSRTCAVSAGDVLAFEPVAPALHIAARRRGEMRKAAQRAGVAVRSPGISDASPTPCFGS